MGPDTAAEALTTALKHAAPGKCGDGTVLVHETHTNTDTDTDTNTNTDADTDADADTGKRITAIVDDANTLVEAARVVQRSFRTSVQRRIMHRRQTQRHEEEEEVPPRPLRPFDRASPNPDLVASAVRLQTAIRTSLNRRRRETTNLPGGGFPRRPMGAPLEGATLAPDARTPSKATGAPRRPTRAPPALAPQTPTRSERINQLAAPRTTRIPRPAPKPPPTRAATGTTAVARPVNIAFPPVVKHHGAGGRPSPRHAWH